MSEHSRLLYKTPFGFWSYTVRRRDGRWVGGGGCSSKKRAQALMERLIERDVASLQAGLAKRQGS